MDFATLFRTKENLNLDKNTLTILRYIAIFGQFIAINIVFYYLKLEFPIDKSYLIISLGLFTNLFLQFKVRVNQLKDTYASFFLLYDLIQLSILLYLTGGILNPFSFLLIIPAIVSSTFLSMGTTIILSVITSLMLLLLTYFYLPLPGMDISTFNVPNFYKFGILTSILIGLSFLSYFGIRFSGEIKKRSKALNRLQEVIAKEYELESLDGQAAAAAHSLGTPLATISVVAKELSNSFQETSSKKIELSLSDDLNKIYIQRSPEIIYGLRNFIGNAVKFSKSKVDIDLKSNEKIIEIKINDDGPGIPEDIIKKMGEPYIKSKSEELSANSGLGLGTFLGKTLLERQGANLLFKRNSKLGGALVVISWSSNTFTNV